MNRAANNEQKNEQQNEQNSKKIFFANYLIRVHQSFWLKIILKVKPSSLQLLMNRKRLRKNILQILLYLPQLKHWVTYLKISGRCLKRGGKVIHEHSHASWTDSCNGEWLNCALEVLQENIYPPYFSAANEKLLQTGSGNSRKILIIVRENRANFYIVHLSSYLMYFLHHQAVNMHG